MPLAAPSKRGLGQRLTTTWPACGRLLFAWAEWLSFRTRVHFSVWHDRRSMPPLLGFALDRRSSGPLRNIGMFTNLISSIATARLVDGFFQQARFLVFAADHWLYTSDLGQCTAEQARGAKEL